MNTDTIQAIAQVVLILVGPWLARNHISLTSIDLTGAIGAIMTAGGIIWKALHLASLLKGSPSQTTTNITAGKGNGLGAGNVPIFLAFVLPSFAALLFAGCASNPAVVGHVVSVTDRGFGVNIQTASSPNSTPTVKLGFFSQTVFIEPVATNATLETPAVANTFALDNTGTPFAFGVNETIASQDYQTGSATNSIAAQPIIPK